MVTTRRGTETQTSDAGATLDVSIEAQQSTRRNSRKKQTAQVPQTRTTTRSQRQKELQVAPPTETRTTSHDVPPAQEKPATRPARTKAVRTKAPPSASARSKTTTTTRSASIRGAQPKLIPSPRKSWLESDSSMSSRSTTPSCSPVLDFPQPKDYVEDKKDAQIHQEDASNEDDEIEDTFMRVHSEDELAGPKTPMRRLRPSSRTRRAKAVPATNAMRNSSVPMSEEMEPEIVGSYKGSARDTGDKQSMVSNEQRQDLEEESMVILDDIYDSDSLQRTDGHSSQVLADAQTTDCSTHSSRHVEVDTTAQDIDRQGESGDDDPDETILVENDVEAEDVVSPASDHSVVINRFDKRDVSHDSETDAERDTEVGSTTKAHRDEDDEDEEDYADDYTTLTVTAKTPRPQTILWENIQHSTIVRTNLGIPITPKVEGSLGMMEDLASSSPIRHAVAAKVEEVMLNHSDESVEFTEFVTMPRVEADTSRIDLLDTTTQDASRASAEDSHVRQADIIGLNQIVADVDDGSALPNVEDVDDGMLLDVASDESPLIRQDTPDIVLVRQRNDPDVIVLEPDEEDAVLSNELSNDVIADRRLSSTMLLQGVTSEDSTAQQTSPVIEGAHPEAATDTVVPHYMHSTIAFDARRNSLPGNSVRTPLRSSTRPSTSDGSSTKHDMPSDALAWSARPRRQTTQQQQVRPATPRTVAKPASTPARRHVAPFAILSLKTKSPVLRVTTATSDNARSHQPDHNTPRAAARVATRPRTPRTAPVNREADILRRSVLKHSTPVKTRSPARTPLRSLALTPGFSAIRPHPTIPLRGVVAIVEVYTLEGASASAQFANALHRLGAQTTKIWGDRVTHVVYKDGPPSVLQKVALHNKRIDEISGSHIRCVNTRWVSDCESRGERMPEDDETYTVSTQVVGHNARRKRKSMEPASIINKDGTLIRSRKNSWGRTASGRLLGSPMTSASPSPALDAMANTPGHAKSAGKENDRDDSPATPAWLAAPKDLIQATAPLKRVRRLESTGLDRLETRRRTMWNSEGV